jgi:hypothetical protein
MDNIHPSTMEKYNAVLSLCMQSRAFYRYTFCGTKNKSQYLKIVTKKGTYFTPQELQYIDQFITHIAGTSKTISANRETCTLSITFYDPGHVQKQVASSRPANQGRITRR